MSQFYNHHTTLFGCLGWLISTILGGLITFFYTRWRDNRLEKDTVTGLCNSIAFALALQASELTRLQEDIKNRLLALQELNEAMEANSRPNRDTLITVSQAFTFCNLEIDIGNAIKIILPFYERIKNDKTDSSKQNNTSVLQSVFIASNKYASIKTILDRFDIAKAEMKKSSENHGDFLSNLTHFVNNNFPEYLKFVTNNLNFNKKVIEAFKMLAKDKLKTPLNIQYGESVKTEEFFSHEENLQPEAPGI